MSFYKIAVPLLFAFGIASGYALAEQSGGTILGKAEQLKQVLQTKGGWFNIPNGIYLGMEQSSLLKIDPDVVALIPDEGEYSKVLVNKIYKKKGSSVFYGFSDSSPNLESIMLTQQLSADFNKKDVLASIVAGLGKPSSYQTEVQKGNIMVVLIWDKEDFRIAVSYSPQAQTNQSSFIIMRVVDSGTQLKSILRSSDSKTNFSLDAEKKFIESLLKSN